MKVLARGKALVPTDLSIAIPEGTYARVENEFQGCPCGKNRIVYIKNDISEMEALSQKFEQEDGILEEVQQQILRGDDMYLQAKLFPCSEGEAYTAYCEIDSSVNGKEPIKSRGAEVTDPTSAFSGRSPSLPVNGLIDLNSVPIKNSEALPVDQDNDDYDSEIFRVKRRSSVKIERRTLDNVMNSKSMEQPIASEGLKHRVLEVSLADLQADEDQSYRKICLRLEDVQGKNVLTNFWIQRLNRADSDFAPLLQHAGVPSVNVYYG